MPQPSGESAHRAALPDQPPSAGVLVLDGHVPAVPAVLPGAVGQLPNHLQASGVRVSVYLPTVQAGCAVCGVLGCVHSSSQGIAVAHVWLYK